MTGTRRASLLVLAAVTLAAGSVRAQGDEAEGRRRWHHGQELYDQGHYIEAAHEFESGYAVAPRPLFFLSIGHAYRKAHDLPRAKAAYEKLLSLQPDFPGRGEIEGYIKSINDALQVAEPSSPTNAPSRPSQAQAPAASTPVPAASTPAPPPTATPAAPPAADPSLNGPYGAPAMVPPAPSALIETSQPGAPAADDSRSVLRKPWFWVIVGAVVAGSVAAAVIASHPSSSCPGTLCIRETRQ